MAYGFVLKETSSEHRKTSNMDAEKDTEYPGIGKHKV